MLCNPAYAARPYETRTAWVGGIYWVGAGTGNTVEFTGGADYHSNAVWVKNEGTHGQATMNYVHINWNGSRVDIPIIDDPAHPEFDAPEHATGSSILRYVTSSYVSANTGDFLLKSGEEMWLDPWVCSRIEVTGNLVGEGKPKGQGTYIRVLGLVEY